MKKQLTVYFVDDDHGPIDWYVDELKKEFGDDKVVHQDSLTGAVEHLNGVSKGEEQLAELYVFDMMMPAEDPTLAEETKLGMASGLYLLDFLRKVEKQPSVEKQVPIFVMTNVTSNHILKAIKERGGNVKILPKQDVLPSELASKAKEVCKP